MNQICPVCGLWVILEPNGKCRRCNKKGKKISDSIKYQDSEIPIKDNENSEKAECHVCGDLAILAHNGKCKKCNDEVKKKYPDLSRKQHIGQRLAPPLR